MKKLVILLAFIGSSVFSQSKEHKHSLQGIKKVRILSNTKIKVVATNTNSLLVKNYEKHSENRHERIIYPRHSNNQNNQKKKEEKRKGLTAIYPGGKDNTNGFGFSITKEGNTLIVKDLKSRFQRNGIQFELPKNINVFVDSGNLGSIDIEGFSSEIEADSNCGEINMKNVTGPITAHSSVGAITIDFSKVNQSSPISISSSVGEIDIAIPASTKADLEIKTNKTVYTNFDVNIPTKEGLKNVSGSKRIISTINNGGVQIKLISSMGDIYLRKK
ncbi:hypothetical protein [Tenacibaculum sp. nBUS_03]|uniref:hypothetical protein n=1 Tax=Tenacibaculum sp. nBUS_03 TaxID=3395320 RepID=UPI003EB91292